MLESNAKYISLPDIGGPLTLAVEGGNQKVIELLIDKRRDYISGEDRQTASDIAARKGFYPLAYFLSPDPKVKRMSPEQFIKQVVEQTRKKYLFLQAANVGSVDTIKELLNDGDGVDARPGDRRTALQEASTRGFKELVRVLLDRRPDLKISSGVIDWKDPGSSGNVLRRAAQNGRVEVIRMLLESGANVLPRDSDKTWSPIERAAEKSDIVKLLVQKGADIDTNAARPRRIPLIHAAVSGYLEMAQFLLANGANVDAHGEHTSTALYFASERGYLEIVRLLIGNKANVNFVNRRTLTATALQTAASLNHVEIVELLLSHGADVNIANAHTPLQVAVYNNHPRCCEVAARG